METNPILKPIPEKKETFGEQYIKGIQQESGTASVKDIRNGMLTDWDKNVLELIQKTRAILPSQHFYVCVTTKREYLAKNTIRNYFESKYDCPTPTFEQVVYKIHKNSDQAVLIWVIPNKEACRYLQDNAQQIPPEEQQLLGWVLAFGKGQLDQLAQKENGEIIEKINT